MNIPILSKLYVLSCMLNGVDMDPRVFFAYQLCSAANGTKGRLLLKGLLQPLLDFSILYPKMIIKYLGLRGLIMPILS